MSGAHFRNGVAFSIEAMLAAMLLFTLLLFSSTMSAPLARPFSEFNQLSAASGMIAEGGIYSGAWLSCVLAPANDSFARAATDSLQPSICARAEIFNGSISADRMLWSYANANCSGAIPAANSESAVPFVRRYNSSSMDYLVVRVAAWPRSG